MNEAMDPAHPVRGADFFRIQVPARELLADKNGYVRFAKEPFFVEKTPAFRHLSLTDLKAEAAVYPRETAQNVLYILKGGDFPGASLEPATFEEWVSAALANQ